MYNVHSCTFIQQYLAPRPKRYNVSKKMEVDILLLGILAKVTLNWIFNGVQVWFGKVWIGRPYGRI